jgi:hypothetical protein
MIYVIISRVRSRGGSTRASITASALAAMEPIVAGLRSPPTQLATAALVVAAVLLAAACLQVATTWGVFGGSHTSVLWPAASWALLAVVALKRLLVRLLAAGARHGTAKTAEVFSRPSFGRAKDGLKTPEGRQAISTGLLLASAGMMFLSAVAWLVSGMSNSKTGERASVWALITAVATAAAAVAGANDCVAKTEATLELTDGTEPAASDSPGAPATSAAGARRGTSRCGFCCAMSVFVFTFTAFQHACTQALHWSGVPDGNPAVPGEYYDIGNGRKLMARCLEAGGSGGGGGGSSRPFLLMEHGIGGNSLDSNYIQPKLAASGFSSCSYDRAGYGYSQAGPYPRDLASLAEDAHALIAATGHADDMVVHGGHSTGGGVVRLFYGKYKDEGKIAGLILNDPIGPERYVETCDGGAKNAFLEPVLIPEMVIVSRQARDKHRESTQKRLFLYVAKEKGLRSMTSARAAT